MDKAVLMGSLNMELNILLNYAVNAREAGVLKRSIARYFTPCTFTAMRDLVGRLLTEYDLEPDDFPLALTAAALLVRKDADNACLVARKALNRKRELDDAYALRARSILIMGGEGEGEQANWKMYEGAPVYDRGTVLIILAAVITENLDEGETRACRQRAWRIASGDPSWRAVYYSLFGDPPIVA